MKTMSKYEVIMLKDVEEACNLRRDFGDSWYDLAVYVENVIYIQETYYNRSAEFIRNLQNMKENYMNKCVEEKNIVE